MKRKQLALYGVIFIVIGFILYLSGVLMALPRRFIFGNEFLKDFNHGLVWYSGMPIM